MWVERSIIYTYYTISNPQNGMFYLFIVGQIVDLTDGDSKEKPAPVIAHAQEKTS